MTTPNEVRTYAATLEVRDIVGKPYRYLEGRAVPYDTWERIGWFYEQHAQDSFKKSTKAGSGQHAPLLLFHDNRTFPIGHAEEWRHDDGLCGVWRLNDSPEAQRAAGLAAEGDLTGMSVGFSDVVAPKWDWAEDWAPELGEAHTDHVTRLESRLFEVSLTPTPAFADASVALVRSALGHGCRAAGAPEPAALEVDAWRAWAAEVRSGPSD